MEYVETNKIADSQAGMANISPLLHIQKSLFIKNVFDCARNFMGMLALISDH